MELYTQTLNLNNYEIILTKDNNYQTIIDNNNFVLIKRKNNLINLNFINLSKYAIYIKDKQVIPWDTLWEQKVDYYEKYIKTLPYSKMKNCFHYYIGMTENAISLYKMFKQEGNVYLSHIRLRSDEDYLNPINYVIDYRSRDLAEYIKKLFFEKRLVMNDIFTYIASNQYTSYECILLFIRLLYPSYFFDAYDLIVQGEEENILDIYIVNMDSYEFFLNDMYFRLKPYVNLPKIEWLTNKKDLSFDKS